MKLCLLLGFSFWIVCKSSAQIPQRLQIPGAVLLSTPPRPRARSQQLYDEPLPAPRARKPPLNYPSPVREQVRPVIEDTEENIQQKISNFDDEVSRLGISSLQSAVGQAALDDDQENVPKPIAFRPERPVPILRESIRDNKPLPPLSRPVPVIRQELSRPIPVVRENIRPQQVLRQEVREEAPRRLPPPPQPVRQQAPAQSYRPVVRTQVPTRQPAPQYLDDGPRNHRTKKPPVQILRKYRTDNEDGSITWGFENDDGTFKEETLGADCIVRGKYGYVDPDGVRREYTYETGSKCEEEEPEELPLPPRPKGKVLPQQQQYRPAPQY